MNNKSILPVVMIGAGGHANVLADILLSQGRKIIAVISPDKINYKDKNIFSEIPQLFFDDEINFFSTDDVMLVNGIGKLPRSSLRENRQYYFSELGYQFSQVIADSAYVSNFASLGEGVQILTNAVVHANSIVDPHSIINTGAIVEHDCHIGLNNHIAPKALLCGQVTTKKNVFIGANATILQTLTLDEGCIVGAGITVTKNISANTIIKSKSI